MRTPPEETMIGGGETENGIFVVVVRSVTVVVMVVVSVHFLLLVDVRVIFVVVAPTMDEHAEDIVWDAQFVRAVGVAPWFAGVAEAAPRLLIVGAGPLLSANKATN